MRESLHSNKVVVYMQTVLWPKLMNMFAMGHSLSSAAKSESSVLILSQTQNTKSHNQFLSNFVSFFT